MRRLESDVNPWRENPFTGCWEWTRARNPRGYGRWWDPTTRRTWPAHRLMYVLVHGPIPEGLVIDHLCGNKPCVNPAHLEAVTNRVNVVDRAPDSNAWKTRCPQGHPYDTVDAQGKRRCRTCRAEQARERRRIARVQRVYGQLGL